MSQFETPMLMKATRSTALAAAKRMSLPSASARPKPAAGPLIAAITGCGVDPQPEDQARHVLLVAEPVARVVGAVVAGRRAVAAQVEAGAEPAPSRR